MDTSRSAAKLHMVVLSKMKVFHNKATALPSLLVPPRTFTKNQCSISYHFLIFVLLACGTERFVEEKIEQGLRF